MAASSSSSLEISPNWTSSPAQQNIFCCDQGAPEAPFFEAYSPAYLTIVFFCYTMSLNETEALNNEDVSAAIADSPFFFEVKRILSYDSRAEINQTFGRYFVDSKEREGAYVEVRARDLFRSPENAEKQYSEIVEAMNYKCRVHKGDGEEDTSTRLVVLHKNLQWQKVLDPPAGVPQQRWVPLPKRAWAPVPVLEHK